MTLQLSVSSSEFSENANSFFRKFVSRTIFSKNVNGRFLIFRIKEKDGQIKMPVCQQAGIEKYLVTTDEVYNTI